jgi:hypothetical protein
MTKNHSADILGFGNQSADILGFASWNQSVDILGFASGVGGFGRHRGGRFSRTIRDFVPSANG